MVAIEVPDRPGGLAEVLDIAEQGGINIEYMYAFTDKLGDKGVLVFRFDDPDKAIHVLGGANFNIIERVDLFNRLGIIS